MVQSPVTLDYSDLINPDKNLNELIEEAFGNRQECLGLCFVRNVPKLVEKRETLLRLASKLANLGEQELKSMENPESKYSFGWSHGKEVMNGKPDFAKGSFYNNPIFNNPANGISADYSELYPAYAGPNVWPLSLPELEDAFMDLGSLIVEIGKLVALHCDKYLAKTYHDLPSNFLQVMISKSVTHKARLLHYFPISEKEAEPAPDGSNVDSWCGIHVDHSVLTGLTSAMYIDESDSEQYPEIDKSTPKVAAALKNAGLFIKNRDDSFTQVLVIVLLLCTSPNL